MLLSKFYWHSNLKIVLALGAIVVASLVSPIALHITLISLRSAYKSSQVNNDASYLLHEYVLNLRTAESSDRGYFLDGDTTFLDKFRDSTALARTNLTQLTSTTLSATDHQQVMALVPLTDERIRLMEENVQIRQAANPDLGQLANNFSSGRTIMDKIDILSGQIEAVQRYQEADDLTHFNTLIGAVEDITIVVLLLTLTLSLTVNYLFLKAIQAESKLDRAKVEFVSLASHQLRTPATGIKSILAMLAAGDFGTLTPNQKKYIDKAVESNERELRIIEELLYTARADAGLLVLHASEVDLTELVNAVATEQQPAFVSKSLNLSIEPPKEPVVLKGDHDKLFMAIGNLLDNARKYTPENGSIGIRVYRQSSSAVIEITDTGLGIDEVEQLHLFDRFQRARDMLESNVEGTGLGLYLARRITELHNGTIHVNSQKGHGSKFIMKLPIRRV